MIPEVTEEMPNDMPSDAIPFTKAEGIRKDIPKSRFLVNETVIYTPAVGQAVEIASHSDASFIRLMQTDEQPYRRKFVCNEEWKLLDYGWCGPDPAHIIIMNEEGQFRGGIPTKEKRAEMAAKVIEIGIQKRSAPSLSHIKFAEIPILESCRFQPASGIQLYIRCRSGEARVTLACIPGEPR